MKATDPDVQRILGYSRLLWMSERGEIVGVAYDAARLRIEWRYFWAIVGVKARRDLGRLLRALTRGKP